MEVYKTKTGLKQKFSSRLDYFLTKIECIPI